MDLDGLTSSQRAAVEHQDGPLLVLAGPGSGKTRVVTRRIARLVDRGVDARAILAITFTNKAAREMAERVSAMLPDERVFVSTFHRFCARLLRQYADVVGLQPNYTILDKSDQIQVVRRILHELNYDATHYNPSKVAARISRAKNDLIRAEEYVAGFEQRPGPPIDAVVARAFPEYQQTLLASNAVDFDDLLIHVVDLLTENPELRESLDRRYRHVLVDEYQDTNRAQYRIVALLSQDVQNLCVTGDPDQSIYGWRGARIDNILRFEQDFPDVAVVRLDENFRSTKCIVSCADRLIANNTQRKQRELTTDNDQGRSVELLRFPSSIDEADGIAAEIRRRVEQGECRWADFAIFYRVNALSRQLETAVSRHLVPFQVAAGLAFYERAEIKDLLAYLRLIENPVDEPAFLRIVNTPARGIGKKSIAQLTEFGRERRLSLLSAAERAGEIPRLAKRSANALRRFSDLIAELRSNLVTVAELLSDIIERTEYTRQWDAETDERDLQRLANVDELVTAARQYEESAGGDGSLQGFLETTSLVSDVDGLDESGGTVTMMTLHAAKGLEFPIVFIVGVEENLIPHERAVRHGELSDLEEERRLLFVGITRAQRELYLTQTAERTLHGSRRPTIRSSFLPELDVEIRDLGDPEFATDEIADEFRESMSLDAISHLTSSPDGIDRAILMTAADLENGVTRAAEIPSGFGVGMLVRHPRYGRGTVVDVSGMVRRRKVVVEFENDGARRRFDVAHSPLQPIGVR